MDVTKLLESASLLVPEEIATENDVTVRDVWDYLAHDEWQIALSLLEELGTGIHCPCRSGSSWLRQLSNSVSSGAQLGATGGVLRFETGWSGRI